MCLCVRTHWLWIIYVPFLFGILSCHGKRRAPCRRGGGGDYNGRRGGRILGFSPVCPLAEGGLFLKQFAKSFCVRSPLDPNPPADTYISRCRVYEYNKNYRRFRRPRVCKSTRHYYTRFIYTFTNATVFSPVLRPAGTVLNYFLSFCFYPPKANEK